jgi:hypothetical protein
MPNDPPDPLTPVFPPWPWTPVAPPTPSNPQWPQAMTPIVPAPLGHDPEELLMIVSSVAVLGSPAYTG